MWSATTSAASAGTTKEHVILRPWHWAQHAADDRKGLLYYPVDGAIQVQDSASLEKCSTGATGLPWSNQVASSISCAPSIYPSLSTIFTESLALTSSSGICFTFSLAWAWWHHFCLACLFSHGPHIVEEKKTNHTSSRPDALQNAVGFLWKTQAHWVRREIHGSGYTKVSLPKTSLLVLQQPTVAPQGRL